ncbi:MAG TPA: hypothetical protein VFP26_00425, partial [Gemmatimonadaceae bacterium]|nr:hypothetical protein [Gemmatimonadaceae bacterium]
MTEARLSASDLKVIREVIRRAGHEIRNALNGVAVNVEVVRSRLSRDPAAGDTIPFAERAILNLSAASVLTNGLLALTNATLTSGADPVAQKAKKSPVSGGSVELTLGNASAVLADIRRLAAAIDVSVEERGANVILRVLPEGQS